MPNRILQALEEVERAGIPGLLEVLREEGIDGVRYALWNVSGWHRDYSPPAWRNRATEKQKREGWEMAVRIEIITKVLHEGLGRQVEEVMDALSEGPKETRMDASLDLNTPNLPPVPPVKVDS